MAPSRHFSRARSSPSACSRFDPCPPRHRLGPRPHLRHRRRRLRRLHERLQHSLGWLGPNYKYPLGLDRRRGSRIRLHQQLVVAGGIPLFRFRQVATDFPLRLYHLGTVFRTSSPYRKPGSSRLQLQIHSVCSRAGRRQILIRPFPLRLFSRTTKQNPALAAGFFVARARSNMAVPPAFRCVFATVLGITRCIGQQRLKTGANRVTC